MSGMAFVLPPLTPMEWLERRIDADFYMCCGSMDYWLDPLNYEEDDQ